MASACFSGWTRYQLDLTLAAKRRIVTAIQFGFQMSLFHRPEMEKEARLLVWRRRGSSRVWRSALFHLRRVVIGFRCAASVSLAAHAKIFCFFKPVLGLALSISYIAIYAFVCHINLPTLPNLSLLLARSYQKTYTLCRDANMTVVDGPLEEESYFSCKRLNATTFVVVEWDRFEEKPFIYAKICKDIGVLVLSDTGCGGDSAAKLGTLRAFLENHPVPENGHVPLNPCHEKNKHSLEYVVILTHCHYDHILGIPEFIDSKPTIVASKFGKSFIESDLPGHSLCKYRDVPTPVYEVSLWAANLEWIVRGRIQIVQTPGHTPDELAWYDVEERHLYVGDSFYDRVSEDGSYTQPIIFPPHGDLVTYMASLDKLLQFVEQENQKAGKIPVKVGCGHTTSSADARSTITEVQVFFWDVFKRRIPVKSSTETHGIIFDLWEDDGSPRFSLQAPRVLVERARKQLLLDSS